MRRAVGLMCGIAALLYATTARAHEFTCEETIDGASRVELSSYPATLHVSVEIDNSHPSAESEALDVESVLLDHEKQNFSTPFTLAVGGSVSKYFELTIGSYEQCLYYAALDGRADDRFVAPVIVRWDEGEAQCWAEIVCKPPVCEVTQ